MTVIPFQINGSEYSVFIALGDDSVKRIQEYDPAEVSTAKLPALFRRLKLRDIIIGYATPADSARVIEMIRKDDNPREALKYLSRGFVFKPEAGDHDGPYLSAKSEGSKQ